MKNFLLKLSIVLGLLFALLGVTLSFAYGFSFSNTLAILIGLVLFLIGMYYNKLSRNVQRLITFTIAVGLGFSLVVLAIVISQGAKSTTTFTEEAVVVLGAGIRGERITLILQQRLDKCLEYLQKNPNAVIVVSGGQGRGEDISEALAMERYLIAKGANPDRLMRDDESKDTYENLVNTKAILDSHFEEKSYSLVCITSDTHMYRAIRIGRRMDVNMTSYSAPVAWFLRPGAYLREICSVCKFWVYR